MAGRPFKRAKKDGIIPVEVTLGNGPAHARAHVAEDVPHVDVNHPEAKRHLRARMAYGAEILYAMRPDVAWKIDESLHDRLPEPSPPKLTDEDAAAKYVAAYAAKHPSFRAKLLAALGIG